jgi:metallo-beta-lactamase family protein
MSVRLSFHGAAQTVTGSCYLLDVPGGRVMVDCGMFQGTKTIKELNYGPFPFEPGKVDALVLTHAHIDHSGLIPKLVKGGFSRRIHATAATVDLCAVMLPDSGHIQETEVMNLNRRNAQRGRAPVAPIYTEEDARDCLSLMRAHDYETWFSPVKGVRARFWNAGHLLGSASVEVEVENGGPKPLRLLFSGDLGPDHKALLPDPEAPQGFDHVICESTYGATDRIDVSEASRRAVLAKEVTAAQTRHGALLIPSFAVERTQELLVDLVALMEAGTVARAPIFIDSPLAAKASDVFEKHMAEIENGQALVRALNAENVRIIESVDDSKRLARIGSFHIIISASGMCEAGRIRHHLKNWLWHAGATVLLVGYQAEGTLGRLLQEGAARVRIQGDEVNVAARIRSIDVYSGHADAPELEAWIEARQPIGARLFLTHGELPAMQGLHDRLVGRGFSPDSIIRPALDETWLLSPTGAQHTGTGQRRLAPADMRAPDIHNDAARLMLDIGQALDEVTDRKQKATILRKLRRALDDARH